MNTQKLDNISNITTFPNQRIIHINKNDYKGNYLTIGNDEWINASKDLKPITFRLYLYLASNMNGFDLALSRQAVINKIGISKNSYINGINELKKKGYIVLKQGNVYDFYASPMYQHDGTLEEALYQPDGTSCTNAKVHNVPLQEDVIYQSTGTEINKKRNKYTNKSLAGASVSAYADEVADATKQYEEEDEFEEIITELTEEERILYANFLKWFANKRR